MSAIGLTMADLFEEKIGERTGKSTVEATVVASVGALAKKVGLPQDYLVKEKGLRQGGGFVGMPYLDERGEVLFERKRMFLSGGVGPRFRQPGGVTLVPYGLENLKHAKRKGSLVMVEGECLDEHHEVLTDTGWKPIPQVTVEDRVAQWSQLGVNFIHPRRVIERSHEGALYSFFNTSGRFSQVVTGDHKMVMINRNGGVVTSLAKDGLKTRHKLPLTGVCYGQGWVETEKQRALLDRPDAMGAVVMAFGSQLDWAFIVDASADERTKMLEAVKALGHRAHGRNTFRVYSQSVAFTDWVQALCHTSGLTCSNNTKPGRRKTRVLTMNLQNKSISTDTIVANYSPNPSGKVWCLTVPSGAFITRRDGIVSVTGNSDSWTLGYNSIPHLGIPGANATGCLEKDHIQGINKIFVVKEADKAGHQFVDSMGDRLTKELGFKGQLRVIDMGLTKCKDTNKLWRADPQAFPIAFRRLAEQAPLWSKRKLSFKTADSVGRQKVNWFWDPYIPYGFLTMLWGKGGIGKSFLTVDLIAKASTGQPLPGTGTKHKPMNVLLFSCEETLEFQIVPHLEDAGADLSKVHVFDFEEEEFLLSGDYLEDLKTAIVQYDAKLIVMDPVVELMSDANINHANEVRRRLGPLKQIAMKHGCAIVLVHHQKKGQLIDASDGAMGSTDFRNAMRSCLFVMHEPGSRKTVTCMAHEKHNMSDPGETLKFTFGEDGERIEWSGISPYTANDLIAESALPPHELDMVNDATLWLQNELQPVGFAQRYSDINSNAKTAGIAKMHLFLAKTRLGVLSDFKEDGVRWHIPYTHEREKLGAEPVASTGRVPFGEDGDCEGDSATQPRNDKPQHSTCQDSEVPFDVPLLDDIEGDDIWSWEKTESELL